MSLIQRVRSNRYSCSSRVKSLNWRKCLTATGDAPVLLLAACHSVKSDRLRGRLCGCLRRALPVEELGDEGHQRGQQQFGFLALEGERRQQPDPGVHRAIDETAT